MAKLKHKLLYFIFPPLLAVQSIHKQSKLVLHDKAVHYNNASMEAIW